MILRQLCVSVTKCHVVYCQSPLAKDLLFQEFWLMSEKHYLAVTQPHYAGVLSHLHFVGYSTFDLQLNT